MYCPKCGRNNEDGVKVCTYCGYQLKDVKTTNNKKMNYYEILEITPDASQEVIKAAYKALVKKLHPDNVNGQQDGEEGRTIEEVNRAYEVLSNPEQRKDYDATLNNENDIFEEKTKEYDSPSDKKDDKESQFDADDESYASLIAESIASIVAFVAFQHFEFGTWILVITGIVMSCFVGSLISKLLIFMVKNISDRLGKLIYGEGKNEEIKGCCELAVVQLVFVYLKIDNWITKLFLLTLIIMLVSFIYSVVKLLLEYK